MLRLTRVLIAISIGWLGVTSARAQQPTFYDPLLDHLVGKWLLGGTIEGKPIVHDVTAAWVLGHQYLRFDEVSHELNKEGKPAYEATVFIGWDEKKKEYACLWLDIYGGIAPGSIGNGRKTGDSIPFTFHYPGTFHTTFAYTAKTDSWTLDMAAEDKGKLSTFGSMVLKRD